MDLGALFYTIFCVFLDQLNDDKYRSKTSEFQFYLRDYKVFLTEF